MSLSGAESRIGTHFGHRIIVDGPMASADNQADRGTDTDPADDKDGTAHAAIGIMQVGQEGRCAHPGDRTADQPETKSSDCRARVVSLPDQSDLGGRQECTRTRGVGEATGIPSQDHLRGGKFPAIACDDEDLFGGQSPVHGTGRKSIPTGPLVCKGDRIGVRATADEADNGDDR
jgi:hypothetical protein